MEDQGVLPVRGVAEHVTSPERPTRHPRCVRGEREPKHKSSAGTRSNRAALHPRRPTFSYSGPCIFAMAGPVLWSARDTSRRPGHFAHYLIDQGGVEGLDLPASRNPLGNCPEHSIVAQETTVRSPISAFPIRSSKRLQFSYVLLSPEFGYDSIDFRPPLYSAAKVGSLVN